MSKTALRLQSIKIDEYRNLTASFRKKLAGIAIEVHPNVYPGGTDSELLAESIDVKQGDIALDLCTGNGIVALSMYIKGAAQVIGTDLNPAAVTNARRNQELLNAKNINFIEADMFPTEDRQYDVISINPPYTDKQAPDKTAICFWDKNNRVTKTFFKELRRFLKPAGKAYITWSSFADQKLVLCLAKKNGFGIRLINSREGRSGFTYYVYQITHR
jgi:release factor glutamine methyltransferase